MSEYLLLSSSTCVVLIIVHWSIGLLRRYDPGLDFVTHVSELRVVVMRMVHFAVL